MISRDQVNEIAHKANEVAMDSIEDLILKAAKKGEYYLSINTDSYNATQRINIRKELTAAGFTVKQHTNNINISWVSNERLS